MSPGISEKGVASGVSEAVASLRASEKMGQASYPTDPPSTQTSIPKKPAPFSKPFPRDEVFTFRDSIARVSDYDLERVRLNTLTINGKVILKYLSTIYLRLQLLGKRLSPNALGVKLLLKGHRTLFCLYQRTQQP
ncbi:hypothetical protein [Nostoc sp. FACHB-888]|uniref:hypothetical protein n=1 Tax=Nostoc sp. FACHB-888 TaxID=2692842 RepID=UPI00168730AC|nr:hypothetical protein [Nostoc sp. FACHB-888]MBD2248855.1 hypothetical protein [Nostoc sp. FACHB-888]